MTSNLSETAERTETYYVTATTREGLMWAHISGFAFSPGRGFETQEEAKNAYAELDTLGARNPRLVCIVSDVVTRRYEVDCGAMEGYE